MVFAELAGWLQGSAVWLAVFAGAAIVALGIEIFSERIGNLRAPLSPVLIRVLVAITVVIGSTLVVAPGLRVLLAPLLLLWLIPAALELEVGAIVGAGVYAFVFDLGVNLQVLTAAPVYAEYYREVMGFMVLAALLFATAGIARQQRRMPAGNRSNWSRSSARFRRWLRRIR